MADSGINTTGDWKHRAIRAFHHAVDLAKSQTAFAHAIGTSQQNISKLLRHGRLLPAGFVLSVEKHFGVSRHELRPDLYPCDDFFAADTTRDPDPAASPAGRTGAAPIAPSRGQGAPAQSGRSANGVEEAA